MVGVVPLLALLVGSATATPVCDLPQCQCLVTATGPRVDCKCLSLESLTFGSSDLPANASSLSVEGCASLDMSQSLALSSLRSLTIKRVRDLRIASRSFLSGLRHLSIVTIEDTKIPIIPGFTFSGLENIFSITFRRTEIGTILSDAFSDLGRPRHLRFINCTIGDIERSAFGRGENKIANFIIEESKVETIHAGGIWLDDADVVHIDKSSIRRITENAIRLNRVFYLYLTRSSVGSYEAGGISGTFLSGVMVDNNDINPAGGYAKEPRLLLDLRQARTPGSAIAPFFHFTNNVITRVVPGYAFFTTNPNINVALPNNTLGECSCSQYRTFLRSLRIFLDDYTLTAHQALMNHGVCLVNKQLYTIGCPDLVLPLSADVWPGNPGLPFKKVAHTFTSKPGVKVAKTRTVLTRTTTAKPRTRQMTHRPTPRLTTTTANPTTSKPVTTVTRPQENVRLQIKPYTIIKNQTSKTTARRPLHIGKPIVPSVRPKTQDPAEESVFPPTVLQSAPGRPETKELPLQTLTSDLSSLDLQTIWNEIYGGVFALRLRKPLPDSFPRSRLSVKFQKAKKLVELRGIRGEKLAVVTPR